jgi:hypothetical protein
LVPSRLLTQNSTSVDVCQLPVRLHPELSAAALQTSQDKPLALWYALRAINTSGTGTIDYHRAVESLSAYAYSPGTARRHLREGRGAFWAFEEAEDGRTRIRLFSLLRICQLFKVPHISWPVDIPGESFRGLRQRRASMYASWLSLRGDKPISRQAIAGVTGIGSHRQRQYDRISHTSKRPNWAFSEAQGILHPIIRDDLEGKSRFFIQVRQLPNSFATHLTQAPRGMTRKVNAALRRCCERGDATKMVRRYFQSGYQAAHAKNRATEAFIRLPEHPISFLRGTSWALVQN